MGRSNKGQEEQIMKARVFLQNARDPEILISFEEVGITAAVLDEGDTLLNVAEQAYLNQQTQYGNQFAAKDARDSKWEKTHRIYLGQVEVARLHFEADRSMQKKLGLQGARKKDIPGWIAQTRQFYLTALGDEAIQTALASEGISKEKLEAGKQMVSEVEAAFLQQQDNRGDAQQSTHHRNQTVRQLEKFMINKRTRAQIALSDKPQLLEKLGIVV
ncbi:MAG: hypothetical protein KDH95_17475 [Calditrichaeota bacterium]|nr:hypothetical protein [Calditrichota bacterium]MCB0269952.1 hypothetical protein [Calditrichota bacterium]